MSVIKTTIFVMLIGLTSSNGFAHHAYAGVFDMKSVSQIEGKVVRLDLFNPHTNLYLEVNNENGETEEWVIEGPGKVSLARRGWVDGMFDEAELITVYGHPSVQGKKTMWLNKIIKSDGSELVDPLVADDLAIEAERRARLLKSKQQQKYLSD